MITVRRDADTHPIEVLNTDGTGLHVVDAHGGCAPVWSADGRQLAYVDTADDTIVTINPDGSGRAVAPVRAPTGTPITQVLSVSPAGLAIVVVETSRDRCGDQFGTYSRNTVYCGDLYLANLETGALTPLKKPDGEMPNALFGADGSMVVQVGVVVKNTFQTRYVFYDSTGKIIATATIPINGIDLQAYTS